MKFTKMQGCGNDYIYIDTTKEKIKASRETAIKLSDRHFGIGGDGVIFICPPKEEGQDAFMDMYNADGTRGQMCGNGIRCVAKYVRDNWKPYALALNIGTLSGTKTVRLMDSDGKTTVKVNMGKAVFSENPCSDKMLFCVNTGNPHAVTVVPDVMSAPLKEWGEELNCSDSFPEGVNVEFCEVISPSEISLRVFERGSGETLACGTGACASVAALNKKGLVDNKVTVHLPGGDLNIELTQNGDIFMTGDAVTVFCGEI